MGNGYIGSVKWGANGGKWVALVPNGYQSTNNHAVLLVIDMATGQTLRKLDTCNMNNGCTVRRRRAGRSLQCDCTERAGERHADLRCPPQHRRGLRSRLPGQPVEVRPQQRHRDQLAHRYRGSERRNRQHADPAVYRGGPAEQAATDHGGAARQHTPIRRQLRHHRHRQVLRVPGPDEHRDAVDLRAVGGPGRQEADREVRPAEVRLERVEQRANADRHWRILLARQARLVGRPRGQQPGCR